MSTCSYTPPPGQDMNVYILRLTSLITQLNETKNKNTALQRLQLLIDDVQSVINDLKKTLKK